MGLYFLGCQNKLEGQIPETVEGSSGYTQLVEQHISLSFAKLKKLESLELATN